MFNKMMEQFGGRLAELREKALTKTATDQEMIELEVLETQLKQTGGRLPPK